jgi:hypothetical protein
MFVPFHPLEADEDAYPEQIRGDAIFGDDKVWHMGFRFSNVDREFI